jgi:hypothetical protein
VQPVYLQLGNVLKLLPAFTGREHDRDRLRLQATSDEGQRQRRRLIEPLSIVHDAEQRTVIAHLRHQAQNTQPGEEPIRGRAGASPEHDLECLTLRRRKPREPIEHRPAQLMQAGEGQLHIGLHTDRPRDGLLRCRIDQVFQQRRLPDPGVAPQDQRPTPAAADVREQAVQQAALVDAAQQAVPGFRGYRHRYPGGSILERGGGCRVRTTLLPSGGALPDQDFMRARFKRLVSGRFRSLSPLTQSSSKRKAEGSADAGRASARHNPRALARTSQLAPSRQARNRAFELWARRALHLPCTSASC